MGTNAKQEKTPTIRYHDDHDHDHVLVLVYCIVNGDLQLRSQLIRLVLVLVLVLVNCRFGSTRALLQLALMTFVDLKHGSETKRCRCIPSSNSSSSPSETWSWFWFCAWDSCYKIIWTHCAINHSLSSNSSDHIVNNFQRLASN